MRQLTCDILIVGGGLGGTAAALAALRAGRTVCLVEETDWLGGQISSQGVSALDEHRFIESFGGTNSYYTLREAIRSHYLTEARPRTGQASAQPFNPGNAWVSRLCFEPRVGAEIIWGMLQPCVDAGLLQVFLETKAIAATCKDDVVTSVTCQDAGGTTLQFHPRYVLDATELGDLLPLAQVEYVVGAEPKSETGEPHAHPGAGDPEWVQRFTFPFAIEYCPGENHTIDKPQGYETWRDQQPFTLAIDYGGELGVVTYGMFERAPNTYGAFWAYRRLIDSSQFTGSRWPNDIAMINWLGNDFAGGNIIDKDPATVTQMLDAAKRLSLSFLYWLQTEVPRDDGGQGYPEFKLRNDLMGTDDGLAKYPYIRESRRIRALRTIREQDISRACRPGPRATHFVDSVGLGLYPIDIHGRTPAEEAGAGPAWPFQIPLGALIPVRVQNLLAANKNIGTTRITNGAYRLQPIEWNIGEACGALAAFCLDRDTTPHHVWSSPEQLRSFQGGLLEDGVPLTWYTDVPSSHPAFAAIHWLATVGILPGENNEPADSDAALRFYPNQPLTESEAQQWNQAACMHLSVELPEALSAHAGLLRSVWAEQIYRWTQAQRA